MIISCIGKRSVIGISEIYKSERPLLILKLTRVVGFLNKQEEDLEVLLVGEGLLTAVEISWKYF